MKFTILTPCFNAGQWLSRCATSVLDQVGSREGQLGASELSADSPAPAVHCRPSGDRTPVQLHHHIQDGGSSDGTVAILEKLIAEGSSSVNYQRSFISEVDHGMYNALNKALAASDGEIVGHLNADEQYLPGTLQFVNDFFEKNTEIDVLFGAVIVTDSTGNYICFRMPLKPQLLHTQVCHLGTFTASMFFRRSVIDKLGCYFDESFKTAGDADLVCRMLKEKIKMSTVRRYFSVFVDSGDNLALSDLARAERERMASYAPPWAQKNKIIISFTHRLRKLFSASYVLKAFTYRFILEEGRGDKLVQVSSPTGQWKNRMGNL